jgi:hypothetical protein
LTKVKAKASRPTSKVSKAYHQVEKIAEMRVFGPCTQYREHTIQLFIRFLSKSSPNLLGKFACSRACSKDGGVAKVGPTYTCEVAVAKHVQRPPRTASTAVNQVDTVVGTDGIRSKAPFQWAVTALGDTRRAKTTGAPNNVAFTQELVPQDVKVPINCCG